MKIQLCDYINYILQNIKKSFALLFDQINAAYVNIRDTEKGIETDSSMKLSEMFPEFANQ